MKTSFSIRELSRLTGWDRKKIAEVLANVGEEPTLEQIIAAFVSAKAPADDEPGFFNLSELTRLSGLDRGTVAERLDSVASHPGPKGSKRYSLTDALPALIAGHDLSLVEARLKKLRAEANKVELHVNRETRKVVDYLEVKTELQELFKALHRRLAVTFWRENAARLKKAKTAAELAKLGQDGQGKIFDVLRTNYKALLGSD